MKLDLSSELRIRIRDEQHRTDVEESNLIHCLNKRKEKRGKKKGEGENNNNKKKEEDRLSACSFVLRSLYIYYS
jgi:hypothetical protein